MPMQRHTIHVWSEDVERVARYYGTPNATAKGKRQLVTLFLISAFRERLEGTK